MPTSWNRADDNVLRAHLQEALAQRAASCDAADWSYSDYELAAIRAELNERQLAKVARRFGAEVTEPSDSRADAAHGSGTEPRSLRAAEGVRCQASPNGTWLISPGQCANVIMEFERASMS